MNNTLNVLKRFQVILMSLIALMMLRCSEDVLQEDLTDKNVATSETRSNAGKRVASEAFAIEVAAPTVTLVVYLSDEGTFTLDWGDGESETFHIPPSEVGFFFIRMHEYATSASHLISLSGELAKVTGFTIGAEGTNPSVSGKVFNLELLPALNTFSAEGNMSIHHLDFRQNPALSAIVLSDANVKKLFLHNDQALHIVRLNGANSKYDFNSIVDLIHANAIRYNLLNGFVEFINYGTLSSSSIEKLNFLRDTYGWRIEI